MTYIFACYSLILYLFTACVYKLELNIYSYLLCTVSYDVQIIKLNHDTPVVYYSVS